MTDPYLNLLPTLEEFELPDVSWKVVDKIKNELDALESWVARAADKVIGMQQKYINTASVRVAILASSGCSAKKWVASYCAVKNDWQLQALIWINTTYGAQCDYLAQHIVIWVI